MNIRKQRYYEDIGRARQAGYDAGFREGKIQGVKETVDTINTKARQAHIDVLKAAAQGMDAIAHAVCELGRP